MTSTTQRPSPLKIALIGAQGKLGKEIVLLASQNNFLEITESYSRLHPLHRSTKADIIIDVSTVTAMQEHLEIASFVKKPIVIGTTGDLDEALLKTISQTIPVFYASNFSLSMTLFQTIASMITQLMPSLEKAVLQETHHTGKKDRPSGSAKMLFETIRSIRKDLPISMESFRIGDVIGMHDLQFFTPRETIEIIHTATSRSIFAEGALLAAQFLAHQPNGLYGMQDLLKASQKK